VFDLPEGGDEEFLSGLFSPYGRVDSVKVARGSDGRSQGYGYVNMAHWQDAKAVRAPVLSFLVSVRPNASVQCFVVFFRRWAV
jgi:RNA recognition motif. (a.k.a. RRM, RBD, or RNP domain)